MDFNSDMEPRIFRFNLSSNDADKGKCIEMKARLIDDIDLNDCIFEFSLKSNRKEMLGSTIHVLKVEA